MSKSWCLLSLVCCIAMSCGTTAKAVVHASDDFDAEGGGVGFASADTWGNLAGGASDTSAANFAFRELSPALNPTAFSTGSVYIAFDFYSSSANEWGGLALFEGVESGEETLFLGNPNGQSEYGLDLKGDPGRGALGSGVPIDNQVHRIIAQVEFGFNDTYRIWVDNLNQAIPNNQTTIDGFVIDAAWQSVRVASNVDLGTTVTVDNLVIADSPVDVGLQPSFDAMLTVNRTTGEVSLSSSGGVSNVVGYSLRSAAGSFNQAAWNTIDGRDATDATPAGDGSLDNDDWQVLTAAGSVTTLSEFTFDATPGDGLSLSGTPLSLGTPWVRSPIQDLFAVVTVDENGSERPLAVEVVYTGAAIASGDLDGDGDIDLMDWQSFKSGQGQVNAGMTALMAYQLGDLDGNFVHNLNDFDLFEEAYDLANGLGAFRAAITGAPEPGSLALISCAAIGLIGFRRRSLAWARAASLVLAALISAPSAEAVVYVTDDFSSPTSGTGWFPGDSWEGLDSSGVVATHPNGGGNTTSSRRFASLIDPTNKLTYVRFDYRQQEGTGAAWGGFAFFEGANINGDESFFAGANPGAGLGYAFEEKSAGGIVDSMTPFDNQFHTIIGAIDQTGADTVYSIWVDNFDVQNPDGTLTVTGQGSVDAPWQSLRFAAGGNHEFADNLLITDGAEQSLVFAPPTQEVLNLLVNKTTGEVMIENNTGANVALSAYSISSGSGMLNAGGLKGDFNADGSVNAADYTVWRDNLGDDSATLNGNGSGGATVTQADYDLWIANYGGVGGGSGGWDSLAERDLALSGFPQGNGDGTGWEEGGNPSAFEVAEYYLLGESTITGTSISLGPAYGGGAGGNQDLVFEYRANGQVILGSVDYVSAATSSGVPAPEPSTWAALLLASAPWLAGRRRMGAC